MSLSRQDYRLRINQFNQVLKLTRASLRNTTQLQELLHCIGSTLAEVKGDDLLAEDVTMVGALVDVIHYRTSVEVEAMIHAVESITLSEETE